MRVGDVNGKGFCVEESHLGFGSLTTREECCEVSMGLYE